MKVIEDRNEEVILLGDMNKLVGNGQHGVNGNNPKVTFGWKLYVLEIKKTISSKIYLRINHKDVVFEKLRQQV